MKKLLALTLLVSSLAFASVKETYRISFANLPGKSPRLVKEEMKAVLPGIFESHLTDVKWVIGKEGDDYIDVILDGDNTARIDGWLQTVQAYGRDAVTAITQMK